jgi:hypothetical protein
VNQGALNSRCKDKRANVADGKEQWSDMMHGSVARSMGPHLDQFSNRESNALREVNEVFTVLVFAVASVGLDPPPPKKLLMSGGMASFQ